MVKTGPFLSNHNFVVLHWITVSVAIQPLSREPASDGDPDLLATNAPAKRNPAKRNTGAG
jgi:hypothetical protein